MTAFTIFVLFLTFVYVVYFAVMITLDLHKKKEVQNSDEEVFDVSDMSQQEEPTCIEEEVNSEENGVLKYTDEITDDGIRILNPIGGNQQSNEPTQSIPEENPDDSDNDELNEEHEENMEVIETKAQESLISDCFFDHLNDMHNNRKLEKKGVIDNV